MASPPSRLPRIRDADLTGADAAAVGALVRAYLVQTEREKAERELAAAVADELPAPYQREVDDPAHAYDGWPVLVAELDDELVGVVVVKPGDDGAEMTASEVKRLWADPSVRGRGVGSALLEAAISATPGPLRLSVWEWRTGAIGLYESRGFVRVRSWDAREQLVCMQRAADG